MEFEGNSYKQKESDKSPAPTSIEAPKLKAKIEKKSIFSRLANEFIAVDAPTFVDHIIFNVVAPKIKSLIWESANDAVSTLLYGNNAPKVSSQPSISGNRGSFVAYTDYAKPRTPAPTYDRSAMDIDGILFETSGDANEFVTYLYEILERSGRVTVNEMYDSIGQVCPPNSERWGWTDLSSTKTMRTAKGFVVKLPRTKPL